MTPELETVKLYHGTTLKRARLIVKNGPDPNFREPRSGPNDRAEGFSTARGQGVDSGTGDLITAAIGKANEFQDEGGPAILEISVPQPILDIVYADYLTHEEAFEDEVRFDDESGLRELLAAWHTLNKRILTLEQYEQRGVKS